MARPNGFFDRFLHWFVHAEAERREILLGSLLLLFIMSEGCRAP